ncbi:hypothetical protein KQ302_08480 [Synechococcus sp. CS-602]|uniref:hypothetical protein n=1 Tax=Synechococcaceae TaxID=1890426 RepID=UPI000ACC12C7|nr:MULTISPECIES: hypothetical protein [Synechococcaceae]MCT4363576.1 hypothetical protein [Candidatus Regnicoccus frigidus MAG-AL1]MCT0202252.1 hypothetical protein [Synechococcus sp. CS-603]MCT0205128.1 hypothetical protein [Synechococcus sp. CS-602]MCT0245771.1 hypothetical protein [Synechococcus sp. CS-601]MCT4367384.1 hypothetical protein [Candidatus Regnicoccus frigidus MAG-AL2]
MTTRTNSAPGQGVMALKQVRELAGADPRFAEALAHAHSPQEAAELAAAQGVTVTPNALWRNRGRLLDGGLPTWRG